MENKEDDNKSEKEKIINISRKLYEILSQDIVHMICLVLLLLSIIYDFHKDYISFIKKISSYDIGYVVAIVVVVWTFTVTLCTYYLQKMDEKFYEIRMIDILLYDLTSKRLLRIVIEVLVVLIILLFGVILEFKVTIIVIALEQVLLMLYMFLTVSIETSRSNVIQVVEKEVCKIIEQKNGMLSENIMLFKMINGIDYFSESDRNTLKQILTNAVSKKLVNILPKEDSKNISLERKNVLQKCVIDSCAQLTSSIINAGSDRMLIQEKVETVLEFTVYDLIRKWYMDPKSCIEVKQGILMALVQRISKKERQYCQSLLAIEDRYKKELSIWCMVYNIYLQGKEGEEWRKFYIKDMEKEFLLFKKEYEQRIALEYWIIIHEEDTIDVKEDFYKLFKYVFFSEDREEIWTI